MKYNEELVEQVRTGKAQIRVDSDSRWGELLRIIFPTRTEQVVSFNYYCQSHNSPDRYKISDKPQDNLPIIHAQDFLIQESEFNWVEVSDDEENWGKAILITDLGERFRYRFICVDNSVINCFLDGKDDVSTNKWKFTRPLPQPEPLTHKQIEGLIGKPFKYVEE